MLCIGADGLKSRASFKMPDGMSARKAQTSERESLSGDDAESRFF